LDFYDKKTTTKVLEIKESIV